MAGNIFILAFAVLFCETQSQLLSCSGPGYPVGSSAVTGPLIEAQAGPRNLPGPINEYLLNGPLNGPRLPGTFGNAPFLIRDSPVDIPPCYGPSFIEDVLNVPKYGPSSESVCANSLIINRDINLNNIAANELGCPVNNFIGPCSPFTRLNGPLSLDYIKTIGSVPSFEVPVVETCERVQESLNPFLGPNLNYLSPLNKYSLPQTTENLVTSTINGRYGTLCETVIDNVPGPLSGCLNRPLVNIQRDSFVNNLPPVNPFRPCGLATESIIENIPVVNNIASLNRPCGGESLINPLAGAFSRPCSSKFEVIDNVPNVSPLISPYNRPCGSKIETVIENYPINSFAGPFNRPCGLPEPLTENVPTINPLFSPYNRPCGPKTETVIENVPTINPFAGPFKRPCGLPEPLIENIPTINPLIGPYNRPCGPKIETVIENVPFTGPFKRPCGLPEPLIDNIPTENSLSGRLTGRFRPLSEQIIENAPLNKINTIPCSRSILNLASLNEPCVLPTPFNIPTANPFNPISNFNVPVLETCSFSPINAQSLPSVTCLPSTIPIPSSSPSICNSSPLIPSTVDGSLAASLANSLQLLLYTNFLESYNDAVNTNGVIGDACFPSVTEVDYFPQNIPCETVETILPNPYGGFTDIVTSVNVDPYVSPNLCGGVVNPLSPELLSLSDIGALPPNLLRIAERVSPLTQNLLADAIRQQNAIGITEGFDPIQNAFGSPFTNFNNLGAFELINLLSQNQIGVPDLIGLLLQKEYGLNNDYIPPLGIPGPIPPNIFGVPEVPTFLPPFLGIEAPQNPYVVPEFPPVSPIDPVFPPPFYYGYESPPFNPLPSPPPIPSTPLFGYTEPFTPFSLEYNPSASIVTEDVSSALQNYYMEVVSPMAEILIPSEIPAQLICSIDFSTLPVVAL